MSEKGGNGGRSASQRGRLGYLCLEPTREGRATHVHVNKIVEGLRELGWRVDLHQPAYPDIGEEPGVWRRLMEFVRVQMKFIRKMKTCDAVYIRGHFAALPTAACARLYGVPMIREVNGTYLDLFIAWPMTRLLAPLIRWGTHAQLRWSNAIIAVTPGLAEWAREVTSSNFVFVVPNAASVQLFQPRARSERAVPSPYVVFMGTFAPWQGIHTMVEAVRHPVWPESVHLAIAGDGELRDYVETVSNSERIHYLGKVPYREVPGIVAESLAGLSPQSHGEGRSARGLFPVKVFETMACGVPIVVTDHPGQAELVRSEDCGLVIEPENPGALAKAVAFLAQNRQAANAMGQRGRKAVEERHSWSERAAQTDEILVRVVSNSAA